MSIQEFPSMSTLEIQPTDGHPLSGRESRKILWKSREGSVQRKEESQRGNLARGTCVDSRKSFFYTLCLCGCHIRHSVFVLYTSKRSNSDDWFIIIFLVVAAFQVAIASRCDQTYWLVL